MTSRPKEDGFEVIVTMVLALVKIEYVGIKNPVTFCKD
jgi:hypothetical protein